MTEIQQKILPHLWFDKQAREAASLYCSVFPDSSIANITTLHDTPSDDCDVVSFNLRGFSFMAISAGPLFRFNPAISFVVNCADQNEIDTFWEKLSAVPEAEQCGWLKDRYGLSWQIVPGELSTMMKDPDPERVNRVTRAFLKMKKFDLALLQEAYGGR